jgi:hypothetical protein
MGRAKFGRKLRGKGFRVLLVAAVGVLAVGVFAFRPIVFTLGDTTWADGDSSSSVSVD